MDSSEVSFFNEIAECGRHLSHDPKVVNSINFSPSIYSRNCQRLVYSPELGD